MSVTVLVGILILFKFISDILLLLLLLLIKLLLLSKVILFVLLWFFFGTFSGLFDVVKPSNQYNELELFKQPTGGNIDRLVDCFLDNSD